MTSGTRPPTAWAVDETRRFFRAFHKHGTEFDKVSRAVGSGRGAEQCESLYRQHQAYLSLDKKFQSEVAFIAMVQDASQHLLKMEEQDNAQTNGEGGSLRQGSAGTSEGGGPAAGAAADSSGNGGVRDGGGAGPATSEGASAADNTAGTGGPVRTLASTRARRTPRPSSAAAAAAATAARTPQRESSRPPASARTPASSTKRPRAPRTGDGIYDYYDADGPGPGAESARKRRSGPGLGHQQKRLDFEGVALGGTGVGGGGARREAADEMGGIDALLTLALVGAESQAEGAGSLFDHGGADGEGFHGGAGGGHGEEEELEEDEEEADAGAIEDQGDSTDEDYLSAGERRRAARSRSGAGTGQGGRATAARRASTSNSAGGGGRRTPGSTPQRPRSRGAMQAAAPGGILDGVGASTPQRPFSTPGAMLASPGLLSGAAAAGGGSGTGSPSPGWMAAAETDLLGGNGDLSNLPDLGYLTSPGLAPGFAAGGAPSPARPMPRLRRRKFAPERSPPLVSPIKALYARRHSLGAGGAGPAAGLLGPAGVALAAGSGSAGGGVAGGVPPPPPHVGAAIGGPGTTTTSATASLGGLDSGASRLQVGVGGGATGPRPGTSDASIPLPPAMTPAEAELRHALTSRARRWCVHEFLYSALDRGWAGDGGADASRALLRAVGLPQDALLTRGEWAALRAGLGRPRRLSLAFLHEQRAELEAWRERVRDADAAVSGGGAATTGLDSRMQGSTSITGHGGTLQQQHSAPAVGSYADAQQTSKSSGGPATLQPSTTTTATKPGTLLPRPLFVGQRVIARHPATRQLHDGAVLTVGRGTARVQFDRRELGVEMVRDTDVAPVDPAENLPPEEGSGGDGEAWRLSGRPPREPAAGGGKSVNGTSAANPLLLGGGPGVLAAPGTAASVPGLGLLGPPGASAETATQGLASAASQGSGGYYGVQGTPSTAAAAPPGGPSLYGVGPEAVLGTPAGSAVAAAAAAAAAYAAASAGGVGGAAGSAAASGGAAAPPLAPGTAVRSQPATANLLAELTVAMHKKEALVASMRAMNDEAAAGVYSDMPGGVQNQSVVQAYGLLMLQLRAVDEIVRDRLAELQGLQTGGPGPRFGEGGSEFGIGDVKGEPATSEAAALLASTLAAAKNIVDACRERMRRERGGREPGAGDGDFATSAGVTTAGRRDVGTPAVVATKAEPEAGTTAEQQARQGASPHLPAPESKLDRLIRTCVAVLLLLQRGAGAAGPPVPLATVAAALAAAEAGLCDGIVAAGGDESNGGAPNDEDKPAISNNLAMEVQSALAGLKSQLLAASA